MPQYIKYEEKGGGVSKRAKLKHMVRRLTWWTYESF